LSSAACVGRRSEPEQVGWSERLGVIVGLRRPSGLSLSGPVARAHCVTHCFHSGTLLKRRRTTAEVTSSDNLIYFRTEICGGCKKLVCCTFVTAKELDPARQKNQVMQLIV